MDSKIAQILQLNQRFIKISKSKKIESLLHHLSFITSLLMISLAVSLTTRSAGQDSRCQPPYWDRIVTIEGDQNSPF